MYYWQGQVVFGFRLQVSGLTINVECLTFKVISHAEGAKNTEFIFLTVYAGAGGVVVDTRRRAQRRV